MPRENVPFNHPWSKQAQNDKVGLFQSRILVFFCDNNCGELHQCSTMSLDKELRKMATEMQYTSLISRISGGDLVAIEAKYHRSCLTAYKNRYRSANRAACSTSHATTEEKILQARVFAEVVSHIEDNIASGTHLFKVSELHNLYESCLREVGILKSIHKTRLKVQLLDHFQGQCQEQSDGKHTVLAFKEGMEKLLKDSLDPVNFESDALLMSKVAKMVWNEIFQWKKFCFSGKFPSNCQNDAVSPLLKSLVSMLINGHNMNNQDPISSLFNNIAVDSLPC